MHLPVLPYLMNYAEEITINWSKIDVTINWAGSCMLAELNAGYIHLFQS